MALLLVVALCIGVAFQSRSHLIKRLAVHPNATSINDFHRWWNMLPQFYRHANYVDDDFPYPPIVIAILSPVTLFSAPNAQLCWTLCKAGLAAAILWLCLSMIQTTGIQLHPAALAVAVVAWLGPLVIDMQQGQTNLLMLLPLCAGLWAAQRQTARSDILAGLLIALAVSVKVTPIIFLIYFLIRKRWCVSAAIVLGMLLWLFLVPGLIFGWNQNLLWLMQWARIMIVPFVSRGDVLYANNQSLPSFLTRFLSHIPAFNMNDTNVPVYVNFIDISSTALHWVTMVLLGGLGVVGLVWIIRPLTNIRTARWLLELVAVATLMLWVSKRTWPHNYVTALLLLLGGSGVVRLLWIIRPVANFCTPRWMLEISAVATFMLWASERTWPHHYVTAILPLLAVAMVYSNPVTSPALKRWAMSALVVFLIATNLTTDAGKILGPNGSLYVRTYGAFLLPSFLLVGILWYANSWCTKPPIYHPGFPVIQNPPA